MSSDAQRLEQLAISPSGFVFDPLTGSTFTVNGSAKLLLDGLRDGLGLDALRDSLQAAFDCPQADLNRDVLEFVRGLREQRLLPDDFELEA